ncbi:MAG: aspartate carbamoyltransferase catalytic subunit [Firmicutes bacterium]|jgi:aspartate carbamoyltransferase catalytic subunit|nr:aspartate carbamoyltransferase catalytic subunit [Bacillota bacterium]
MSRIGKHILGLKDMPKEYIDIILEESKTMKKLIQKPVKKSSVLRGKVVINMFFEASTRTRSSFELAGKYLGADVINIGADNSSIVKGETLLDTAHTIEQMGTDVLILRHKASGAPFFLAEHLDCSVINAGDGMHEHPTQALLDLFTIKERIGSVAGKKVVILGDIAHSRVARSNIYAMKKYGAEVTLCAPRTMMPVYAEDWGVNITYDTDQAVKDAAVINVLRLQGERQEKGLLPTLREYHTFWGMDQRRLKMAQSDVVVLHPGPMNRGVEIASNVADSSHSTVSEQVTNGVAVRMALLDLLAGGEDDE